jgi:protein-disulfide isomerase
MQVILPYPNFHFSLGAVEMDSSGKTPIWRTVFDIGSTVVMIGLAAVLVTQGRIPGFGGASPTRNVADMPLPSEPIHITGSVSRGSDSAKAVLILFSDFECAFCAKFATEIDPVLREEFVEVGQLQIVFKHFPLQNHQNALPAARAAWCAGSQGRFWEMHDKIFGLKTRLSSMSPETWAEELHLNLPQFSQCLTGSDSERAVLADRAQAGELFVKGTPLALIGERQPDGRVKVAHIISGAKPIDEFRKALRALI